jgi:hypothetical protein
MQNTVNAHHSASSKTGAIKMRIQVSVLSDSSHSISIFVRAFQLQDGRGGDEVNEERSEQKGTYKLFRKNN